MDRWVTGSGLDRAALCPGSLVLPRSVVPEGRAATHGRVVHSQLENGEPIAGLSDEQRVAWYPPGGHHEVQVWYDPLTGSAGVHGGGLQHREYSWAEPHFIVGTLDYWHPEYQTPPSQEVVEREHEADADTGCRPLVDDLKTGLPVPTDTLQLGLGALGIAGETGATEILTSITHVPRWGGPPRRDYRLLGPTDLDYLRETFNAMRARFHLDGERLVRHGADSVPVRPGRHCKFCPARKGCGVAQ